MTIKAHFDGKVFVPDEPIDIPVGEHVTVNVPTPPAEKKTAADLLAAILRDPQLQSDWEAIAAGRDSVEVARELRQQAWKRRSFDDPH